MKQPRALTLVIAGLCGVLATLLATPASAVVHTSSQFAPHHSAGQSSAQTTTQANPTSQAVSAPVLIRGKAGGVTVARYTPAQRAAFNRTGGDPAIRAYWTSTRLKRAIPADQSLRADSAKGIQSSAQVSSPAASRGPAKVASKPIGSKDPRRIASVRAKLKGAVTKFAPVNGRVFFHNVTDGRDYSCSGSAINSSSKRLVVTAGHCVYGAPGKNWHANWVFIPGYYEGQSPFGMFQAKTMRTFLDWMNNQDSLTGKGWNSDVAFVTTFNGSLGNHRVVDTVGGHGFAWDGGYGFDATIFGYPTNRDNGQVMWSCWGKTGSRRVGFYLANTISGCNFGPGSSGGPWLWKYDDSSGMGYVRSVTSNGPQDFSHMNGPYFNKRVESMFRAANGDR